MTWKEIKIATLQKMQSADGNDYPTDSSTKDYLAAMPQAANEALQILSTANKFIVKPLEIAQIPVKNVLSSDSAERIQTLNVDCLSMEFEGDGVHAYYIECVGKGKITITIEDKTVEEISVDSKKNYTAYKNLIANDGKKVVMTVSTETTMQFKNVALYRDNFDTAEEIIPYTETVKYDLKELADDFYMIDGSEVYFEGTGPDERYQRFLNFGLEAGHILVLDREKSGNYTIYYKAYPVEITADTDDFYELPLDPEVAALLPLYMASQIYKDDDIGIATTYRNEFEVARELLQNPATTSEYEYVQSESGWI